jgi:NhaP-type Na+/H+ or K+/H+ antiporter
MISLKIYQELSLFNFDPYSQFLYSASESGSGGVEQGYPAMVPLLFVIVALFIGTATRYLLRKTALPYTITLLVLGFALGLAYRLGFFSSFWGLTQNSGLGYFGESVNWAGHIDPHLILYIFLPTLIFEAAFALHIHTFKKSLTNAFILAVPGIILALALTAALLMAFKVTGFGLTSWNWLIAILFGTLISATDPVAVVSILKEAGASKKLATLIEGESLLNDGTAIVIFMVVLTAITGTGEGSNAFVEFIRIVAGGVLIGTLIGWFVVVWLKRVFNDALFEITVVISAAYLAFFMAEHFFHVSGVLAVVTFGIMMAGIGKTRISPQVGHFLHEFWELAAFIANTLIFLIVGVVIALRVSYTGKDFLILILFYIGITLIRGIVIGFFFPLMKRIGYGITFKESIILTWGGLRGAIGLALALIVVSEESIPHEVRDQILALTAGIVMLTSLINATTVKPIISWLGLAKVGEARKQMLAQNIVLLHQSAEKEIGKLKDDRFMAGADWKAVKQYLPKINKETNTAKEEETLFETRKRLLIKEKESYWRQFGEGLLSENAVHNLSDEIDRLLDYGGKNSLANRKDLESLWKTPKILSKLQTLPLLGGFWNRAFYRRLAFSYDCARGFAVANEENLKGLSSMLVGMSASSTSLGEEEKVLSGLEDEINENKIMGLTFLRNLKDTYPEVYHSIETQNASRSLLNHQMNVVQRLEKQGRIEPADAHNLEAEIQGHMKKIIDSPPTYQVAESLRFLQAIPASSLLSLEELVYLSSHLQEKVFPIDAKIATEGNTSDCLYMILRGSARFERGAKLKAMLEPGAVVGAYDTLANCQRWASVVSDSPVTAFRLSQSVIQKSLLKRAPIMDFLWHLAGIDLAERLLPKHEPWSQWRVKKLKNWINTGKVLHLLPGEKVRLDTSIVIILQGEVITENDDKIIPAPELVFSNELRTKGKALVFAIPEIVEKVESGELKGES